jgi:hypothetical protein
MALDPIDDENTKLRKLVDKWKKRCLAAENVIENILNDTYKKTWVYKKWISLKSKMK